MFIFRKGSYVFDTVSFLVDLLVCLSIGYLKKLWTNFDEISSVDRS